ncbi:kelch repeat and BTB domain-containing protein 8-like [Branchiostoma floridae x Branchiostoma japonicum]
MFTSDMAESRQMTIVLLGLDAGMFEEILSYIYSGTLHVSLDKVQPLYQAADLLQLDYVRDTCSSYMAMNVERSTCVVLYKFADVFSLDIVRKRCMRSIQRHFAKVASSEEFCSLSVNQLTEIISHDELDVKEETTVWEAVVRWVQHSREDRLHHLPSILPHIRFNLLTSDDTAAILEHALVREDPGSSSGSVRNVVQKGNSSVNLRQGMETMEMVLLSTEERDELVFMNPREGKYISCNYVPGDLHYGRVMTVTSDNDIYLLSREGDVGIDRLSLFKYIHAENGWEPADMSAESGLVRPVGGWSQCDELILEIDGSFYLVVAMIGESPVVEMRKYDWHRNQWQECSRLHLNTSQRTLQPCGPNLYFLSNTEVHCYDPSQDRWSERSPPKLIPEICSTAAMGTEIFCTDLDFTQTMVYNTVSDSWQELQGWPDPGNRDVRRFCIPRLFVLENQLHILFEAHKQHGWSSGEYLVYVYDRSAGAWRDLEATLPHKRIANSCPCPVARIHLPYLGESQKHITEVSSSS